MHYHHPHLWYHPHHALCCACHQCCPPIVGVPVVVEHVVVQKIVKQVAQPSTATRKAARRNRHAIKALAGH